MDWRISTLILIPLALSGVGAINVVIPEKIYEYARGDNITLPCTFKTKVSNPFMVVISWTAQELKSTDSTLILSHYTSTKETKMDVTGQYEGRVSADVSVSKGQASLTLYSITLADNKIFECRVQIPGDDEGTRADTATLVVLVAPSVPICKIEGKATYGQNINLTCHSAEGSPEPKYSWIGRDVKNMPRTADPRTTDKGGILSLYNLTKETSGYYVCTSKNKIRSTSCNITLSVMPPSQNIGATAGIIAGVAAAVVLLIVLIYCCCCKKKNKEEEYAMGAREEEYRDKEPDRNGESRIADGQEDAPGPDDSSVTRPILRNDHYEERSEREYDDRRSDYNDRRSDYDDRRSDYDDRRSDYDDRRSDYDDRRSDYNDRRSDYDDRRDRNSDRRDDEPYDSRERDRPPVPPSNKPQRRDYDD